MAAGLGLAIVVLVYSAVASLNPSPAAPAAAPPETFSAGRAAADVAIIAREPHPLGSAEHGIVRDYILARARALGLSPVVQSSVSADPVSRTVAPLHNVVARLPGASSRHPILLATHYDSAPVSRGAADDGAGVAALLETARALRSGGTLHNDVVFLFTDGEEEGLLGARAFVRANPWAGDAGVVLNFEARGTTGPVLMFETSPDNEGLIREFARSAPNPRASSLMNLVYTLLPNDTDLTVFRQAGIPGLNFAFIGSPWRYHTPLDRAGNLDHRSLQHLGDYALALTRHFAGLENPRRRSSASAIYFNPWGGWLVVYPQRWAVPLAVLAALLLAGIAGWGARAKWLSPGRLGLGFLACLLLLALSAAGATAIGWLARFLHGRWLPAGDPAWNPGYFLAVVGISLWIPIAGTGWLRARLGWLPLAAGGSGIWTSLALASSIFAPGCSFLFTWPALSSLLAIGILMPGGPEGMHSPRGALAALAGPIPALLLAAPLLSLLFTAQGLGFPATPVFAVITGLAGLQMIPLLEIPAAAQRRRASLVVAGCALICFLAGGLTTRYSAAQPCVSNLRYVRDTRSGQSFWLTMASGRNAWTDRVMPAPRRGYPLVKTWSYSPLFLYQPAPALSLPASRLEILADTRHGPNRILRLRCTPGGEPREIRLESDTGRVLAATVEGQNLVAPDAPPDEGFYLRFLCPPAAGFELTVTLEGTGTWPVVVEERSPGLPPIPGLRYSPRPPGVGMSGNGDQTVVRTTFSL